MSYSVVPLIRNRLPIFETDAFLGEGTPFPDPSQERFAQKCASFVLYTLIGAKRSWEGVWEGLVLHRNSTSRKKSPSDLKILPSYDRLVRGIPW